jgi:Domain of unknown function (DUF4335)
MTIRRQYSLPNCTLVLDGLSDGSSTTGIPDSRPVMSSLFNAECHFVGAQQPLLGGREFLTSLVTTVSNYAQEFLSGISHPTLSPPADSLVSLVKGDREHVHHLQAHLEPNSNTPAATGQPTKIDLSTVQLFDLLEAIDQFLADKRTLPDIMIPLRPLRKALAQPISTQAVPAGLGLASLVAASLIGYALPAPKVSAPQSIAPAAVTAPKTPKPTASPTSSNPATTPQPAASNAPAPASPIASKTGRITEATQIGFLERKLQRDLDRDWQQRDRLKQAANFQVNVNQDGQIVSYKVLGQTNTAQSNLTPLPKLAIENTNPNQAIGDFKVAFNPTGDIQIEPAEKLQGTMSLGRQIADPKLKTTLATQLQNTLQKSLASNRPIHFKNLSYRVAVTKTGSIVDYEPTHPSARKYQAKTPLPKLTQFDSQAAISEEPLAQYKVMFGSNGKILVVPN